LPWDGKRCEEDWLKNGCGVRVQVGCSDAMAAWRWDVRKLRKRTSRAVKTFVVAFLAALL
jgi:hypothetical protein